MKDLGTFTIPDVPSILGTLSSQTVYNSKSNNSYPKLGFYNFSTIDIWGQ